MGDGVARDRVPVPGFRCVLWGFHATPDALSNRIFPIRVLSDLVSGPGTRIFEFCQGIGCAILGENSGMAMSNIQVNIPFDKKAFVVAVLSFVTFAFAIVIYAFQFASRGPDEPAIDHPEMWLLLIAFVFSGIIYFISLRRFERTPRGVIEDIFLGCYEFLGPNYRLNLMKLRPGREDSDRTFGFVAYHHMTNIPRYHGKIKLSTPGVGTAYLTRETVHLGPSQMDRTVDDYPNHVWNAPIDDSKCVLSIDTCDIDVDADRIEKIKKAATHLATDVIAHYRPDSFPFIT